MNIRVSKKHGVNPSVQQCFYCMRDVGVILFGQLPGDAEAPTRACLNKEPCEECAKHMEIGVILISARDGDEGSDNPYRTGGWVVIKEEAIRRALLPEAAESIVQRRCAFVPDTLWDKLGLPRGEQ